MTPKVVFIASHLGYPLDTTPLGGGAAVGARLVHAWSRRKDIQLHVLGSGPQSPEPGVSYEALDGFGGPSRGLTSLNELEYGKFARRFEKESTRWILSRRELLSPSETVVIANDISEGPSFRQLAEAGYPLMSLWHVDVLDYFARFYLGDWITAQSLSLLYEGLRKLGLSRGVPDVLKLVFEKERDAVSSCARLVLPSRAMGERILSAYSFMDRERILSRKITIHPWGVWSDRFDDQELSRAAEELRRRYRIGPGTTVLMTLSRISPEKGLHLLLRALRIVERSGPGDICLLLCGEPAFMQGLPYWRTIRREASKLKRVRVYFPGHLGGLQKQAHFRLARLFVSTSTHESYGLTNLEAMNAGLPILTAAHYGALDWFDPAIGRRVAYSGPREAPRLLAQAIKEMLSDPAALAAMGRAAQRKAAGMPFDKSAEALLNAATSLIEDRDGAVPA